MTERGEAQIRIILRLKVWERLVHLGWERYCSERLKRL